VERSIQRAYRVLELDTSSYHYKSRRRDQADIAARIKDICATRVRYGYRRVHVMLTREGWDINMKRTYRIYRDLGLQLRNKTPKRRVKAKLREDRAAAVRPNDVWTMDFVHDQLATGKKIRVLTVVDTFSRYVPVLDPRFSYRAEDVVRTLEQVCPKSAIRRRSASTKGPSSSPETSTCGPTRRASRSISPGRGSQQTMPTSKLSTGASGQNA
jgi:putative transposase